jgi:uncharacterized protein (UPF0218 family)
MPGLCGYCLTDYLRSQLKHPLGMLIEGDSDKTMKALEAIIGSENPTKLFVVGDSTASHMVRFGFEADIYVVDHKIMRKDVKEVPLRDIESVTISNPAGCITIEASNAVKKAISSPLRTRIIVDGEEDLLTLPIIKFAPEGSLVIYGQPQVGIVIVRVTRAKRMEIEALMEEMKRDVSCKKT